MEVSISNSVIQHISPTPVHNSWRQSCTQCPSYYSVYTLQYKIRNTQSIWRWEHLCESCLEIEIGWLRAAMVKVELRRESLKNEM